MKIAILSFVSFIAILSSCQSRSDKGIKRTIILQDSLPDKVMDAYREKVLLSDISNGTDSFEVRRWYPFYYTDSFPVILQRIFSDSGKLKGECYFFSNRNGKLILDRLEIDSMTIEKFSVPNIPLHFLDSLKKDYSLFSIDSFDLNIIRQRNSSDRIIGTFRNVFLEQADYNEYYCAFVSDPRSSTNLHPSLLRYAKFENFIHNLFINSDPSFSSWYREKLDRIILGK